MNKSIKASIESRRGVLLLVVLSTLIVFLLLGTLLLTQSTRSRTAARAFATMNASSSSNGALARDVLDEALMQLVRGDATDDPTQATDNTNPTNDSILLDKYHGSHPVRANATQIWLWPGGTGSFQYNPSDDQPFLRVVIGSPSSGPNDGSISNPLELNGRIITFLPSASQTGTVSSYRIVRANASGSGYEIFALNMNSDPGATLPTTQCPVIINSPEFRSEGHDSFSDDLWLTEIRKLAQGNPEILRPAFETSAVDADSNGIHDTLEVDNDGDGRLDGVWRTPRTFSPRTLSDGTQYEFDVSYLVQDLDSRVNLNTHSAQSYADSDWSPPAGSGISQADLDEMTSGMGWGESDVQIKPVFDSLKATSTLIALQDGIRTAANGTITGGSTSSGVRQPYIGSVYGRYGADKMPSFETEFVNQQSHIPVFQTAPYDILLYGPSTLGVDLKGLSKVAVDGSGQLRYVFPDGSYSSTFPNTVADFFRFQFWKSPYLNRLDEAASRENSRQATATESIFSLSELERVLRLFDKDANALPQRLAAVLGAESENVRQTITTDSWDTPALTGDVATTILDYFSNFTAADARELLSSDLSAGLRFDVNRPVTTLAQKQLYCRDLFVLLVALGARPDADLAQWVVNVMDYRDSDSNMMEFEWDDDLSNGWDPTSNADENKPDRADSTKRNPVFGVEKPDLVIAQTVAWNKNSPSESGELFVVLYRPPGEQVDLPDGRTIAHAPISDDLAGAGSNSDKLDFGKLVGSDPIWRLHYYELSDPDDPTTIMSTTSKYLLPTRGTLPITGSPYDQTNTTATENPVGAGQYVDAGDYLVVGPPSSAEVTISTSTDPVVKRIELEHGADLRFKLPNNNAANGKYVVTLERLRDPSQVYDASSNTYVAVDSVPVKTNDKDSDFKSFYRDNPFWKKPSGAQPIGANPIVPSAAALNASNRDALNWANRPFISQAEIALVPPGSGIDFFEQIRVPSGTDEYLYLASSADTAQTTKAFNPDDASGRFGGDFSGDKFKIAESLLSATRVQSRVSGTRQRINQSAMTQGDKEVLKLFRGGTDVYPANAPQFSTFREPGRVNLNLMPVEDVKIPDALTDFATQRGWRAVVGDTVTDSLFTTPPPDNGGNLSPFNSPNNPNGGAAVSSSDLLGLGTPGQFFRDTMAQASRHPHLAYKTAIKLANVGTNRSNVFAVWITLRIRNTQTDASTYHRLFAIVDRSIPVAFAPGQNLNSANTIRLKRYLD